MIVLPIVNRERILNVEVTLKDVSKVGNKAADFNINSSDIIIHNKKYNDSFYSKSVATPKSVMSFLRENGKIGKSNILVTTKADEKGLFDIYDVKYPSDKVSDGLDNLIGTLLLDLKNESNSQKGRYLDLYKLGVFNIITEERLTDLEFLSKNMNQLNIANQLISAAKMIFELRTKGDNYGELSQYYYDNPDIVKTEIDIQLITTSQKDNTGVVWVQYSALYYNQQNNLIQGSSEVISRWEIEKVNQKWIVTDIDDLP